jgi:hypothetical protein
MSCYKFAFPVNTAVLEDGISSFQVADVLFVKKSCISEEFEILNDCKIKFEENQVFAIVTVCGNESYAKEQAYKRCSLATDIFKICSDLYHNNFYNPKKWQFDIDADFVTSSKSFCFYKDLDSNNTENFYANFHANRYVTYVDTKLLESRTKWNIEDFESLYHILFSPDANKFHKVIKRACHIYSQSFSINHLYERVVLLCTVLDTLATNEREGKVPQLKKYLPALVLKCERLIERLRAFIEQIYDIRSAYIHNAEKSGITERELDKLEKIVYRVILQMVRNSNQYKSTKELCIAIDKGSFVPILDNLPDIYI